MKALAVTGLGLLLVVEGPGAAANPVARAALAKNQTLARERRGGRAAIAKIPGVLSSGKCSLRIYFWACAPRVDLNHCAFTSHSFCTLVNLALEPWAHQRLTGAAL